MSTGGPNPATVLARDLLAELVRLGVREVVLAPGSRSAPLAFEAWRLSQAGTLRLHVRVDERSAGFLALGLAKVSGQPVVVVCTSGTAVANLAPAVVEASYSAVPLVAVTADRPIESRGVGSPQTIDQVDFFGRAVRFFADLDAGHGGDGGGSWHAARAAARSAVAAARGEQRTGDGTASGGGARPMAHAGPVHLNVGFRVPLVPDQPGGTGSRGVAERAGQPHERPPRPPQPLLVAPDRHVVGTALGQLPARGVVLAGDLPCSAPRGPQQWLAELATACGWPIVSEPSAGLHGAPTALGHGVLVLAAPSFMAEHRPDLVLSIGSFGLSRPTLDLVRNAKRHVAIELPTVGREVCDPVRSAGLVIAGIPVSPRDPRPDPAWLAAWQQVDAVAAEVVSDLVVSPSAVDAGRAPGPITGSAVAALLWSAAPDDALLFVAASWPVRQVEAFAGWRQGLQVVGNRGANGIDGLISTAWGAALAHQARGGGPALALMGDLAFLHDHNGLLAGRDEPRPNLVIVVTDNDGGGIFHQLEQGRPEYVESFERLFATPLSRDLVAIARAAGVPGERVGDGAALGAAVESAQAAGGVHVVVVDVPDRAGEAALMAATNRTVDRVWADRQQR